MSYFTRILILLIIYKSALAFNCDYCVEVDEDAKKLIKLSSEVCKHNSSEKQFTNLVLETDDGYTVDFTLEKSGDCRHYLEVKLTVTHKMGYWSEFRYLPVPGKFVMKIVKGDVTLFLYNLGNTVKVLYKDDSSMVQILVETLLFFTFLNKFCSVRI